MTRFPPFKLRPLCLTLLALTLCAAQPAHAHARGAAAKAASQAAGKKPAKHGKHKKAVPRFDYAGVPGHFGQRPEVTAFEDELVARHGFARDALDATIAELHYVDGVVQLIKPAPPGKPKNWHAYSALVIEPVRIDAGIKFWNDNADTLARAETQYGVPAEIIVGILGVETVYGRNAGRFRVLDALATLAFAYPQAPGRANRMAFFREELANALLLARQAQLDPFSLLGSYAGAIGMPQFMPGSVLKWGVDFDGDGRIDLRDSPADAIGSVANFLVAHGWQREANGALVAAVTVSPERRWEGLIGQSLSADHSVQTLAAAGVTPVAGLPAGALFGLVDLQNGAEPTDYWLGNANFFAITQYNRSYFYAMSVVQLGRAIRLARAG